jgi:hypothetical protein
MSLLDILDHAVSSPAASYIKLLSQYKKRSNTVFCFVEGNEDISFYSKHLETAFENVRYVVCHGKKNVLDNYKNLNWQFYDKKRVIFFIDKDYDDYISEAIVNDDNIFITDYYSIENYLVDGDVLRKFINDNCSIIEDKVIDGLIVDFELKHKDFMSHLTKISAWMIYCRKNKYVVNFNDISLGDLFKLDKDGKFVKIKLSSFKNHFEYICAKTKSNHFDMEQIREIYNTLTLESQKKKFVRGKYELFFMFIYIKYITEHVVPVLSARIKGYNKSSKEKLIRPKVTLQIKEENVFQVLSYKVKAPTSLLTFLSNKL